MLPTGFSILITIWMIILLSLFVIGGYFMFRKFLKSMPKNDGKSTLDWQDHYIEQTRSLWTDETRAMLNDLLQPVPSLFRDTAKRTIAAKIGELALQSNQREITEELVLKGYIQATPKRDHKFLINYLNDKQIDWSPYKKWLQP